MILMRLNCKEEKIEEKVENQLKHTGLDWFVVCLFEVFAHNWNITSPLSLRNSSRDL